MLIIKSFINQKKIITIHLIVNLFIILMNLELYDNFNIIIMIYNDIFILVNDDEFYLI